MLFYFCIQLSNVRLGHQPRPWAPPPPAPPQAPWTLAGSPPPPPASLLHPLIQEGSPTGKKGQQVLAKVLRCLQQILEEIGELYLYGPKTLKTDDGIPILSFLIKLAQNV